MPKWAWVALGTLAVAFWFSPPPELSQRIYNWKQQGKYFEYKSYRIFYMAGENAAAKEEKILLCLHGFPTSSYDWIKVWGKLNSAFSKIIAPDFLGFGFSDKPVSHNYSLLEQADLIEELLKQQSATSIHILTHDYGNSVAQELIARFNERQQSMDVNGINILSVCFLNGGIFPEIHQPRLSQKILRIPVLGWVFARLTFYQVFKGGLGEVFGPDTQPTEEDFKDFWNTVLYRGGYKVTWSILRYIDERWQNEQRWVGALGSTSIQIHAIYGPADPVNPPAYIDYYKRAVPHGSIDILGAKVGHYPQWEAADVCAENYIKFIEEL